MLARGPRSSPGHVNAQFPFTVFLLTDSVISVSEPENLSENFSPCSTSGSGSGVRVCMCVFVCTLYLAVSLVPTNSLKCFSFCVQLSLNWFACKLSPQSFRICFFLFQSKTVRPVMFCHHQQDFTIHLRLVLTSHE